MFRTPARRLFLYFCILFFGLVLLNLDLVPVAWLDETMNLDPAVQWHQSGKYISFIWPNEGSEQSFLCYLPGIAWVHWLSLKLLPFSMFWIRLPFILFFALTLWATVKTARNWASPEWAVFLLLFLFICDKGVFESLRSVRSETAEMMLLALTAYFLSAGNPRAAAITVSLLAVFHPKLWPSCAVLSLAALVTAPGAIRRMQVLFLLLLFPLIFLAQANWDLQGVYHQLLVQSSKHSTLTASGNNILVNHFLDRFFPYNLYQPFMAILHAGALFLIHPQRKKLLSFRESWPEWTFMFTSLCWMIILAPHHRYNGPLLLMGLWVWMRNTHLWLRFVPEKTTIRSLLVVLLLPLILFPFASRMALGFIQREERKPAPVLRWLEKNIPPGKGKKLLAGDAIGYYFCAESRKADYMIPIYPQKFRFTGYRNIYLLDKENHTPGLRKVSEYPLPQASPIQKKVSGSSVTYRGLTLYEITSQQCWDSLFSKYNIAY